MSNDNICKVFFENRVPIFWNYDKVIRENLLHHK